MNPALAQLHATAAEAATTLGRMEESKTGDLGPGVVAFGIVALLAVATALLMWSMVRQIRKVPADLNTPTGRRPRAARAPEADPPAED